jgi:exosortase
MQSMIAVWESSRTFAHGFLVGPAAFYLVWCYRDRIMALTPSPAVLGLVALALSTLGWIWGQIAGLILVHQAALIASLVSVVWATLGTEVFVRLLLPLSFLAFMLPVGTSIEPFLQDLTAWFILLGLKFSQIPYLYEGHRITLSSGAWDVAPDCGGLRYLLPGLALAYAFSTLIHRQSGLRLFFLAASAVALMLVNGIRAYGVIVGDHFGLTEGADHRLFSYTLFGLTIPALYWIGLKLAENERVNHAEDRSVVIIRIHDTERVARMAVRCVAVAALSFMIVWLWQERS